MSSTTLVFRRLEPCRGEPPFVFSTISSKVPVPDGRFGRFLHTPCILLKCAMFGKQNKNDSDKVRPKKMRLNSSCFPLFSVGSDPRG